jgi:hypothetical protein
MARPVSALILALAVSGPALAAPAIATPEDLGTAVSAQIACAGIFVAERAEADVLREDIHPFAPFMKAVTLAVDRKARTVTASAPGAATRTALFRPVAGCTLLTGDVSTAALDAQAARLKPTRGNAAKPWPIGDAPVARLQEAAEARLDRAALDKAVSAAFDEQNKGGYPDTRAIVVVQGGAIVAEHYAPGFDRHTEMLGWSASKSIMGTLVGLLVDDGILKLDEPAPVPEWKGEGDPRAKITLRQLLTMSSGLTFSESYVPGNDSIKMLFEAGDMGAMAAAKPLKDAPGTSWSYSSGTTNILSRIVFRGDRRDAGGHDALCAEAVVRADGHDERADRTGRGRGAGRQFLRLCDRARLGALRVAAPQRGQGRKASNCCRRQWLDFAVAPTTASRRGPSMARSSG